MKTLLPLMFACNVETVLEMMERVAMMEQMTELDAQLTVFLVRPIIGIVNNSKVLATLALNVEME